MRRRPSVHIGGFLVLFCGLAGCQEAIIGPAGGQSTDANLSVDAARPTLDAASPTPDAASPTPDAAPPDAAPPDAAPPDAAPPATCFELYGNAPGYVPCDDTQLDTCEFNATTNGGNCNDMCMAFGGTCVMAYDNSEPNLCVRNDVDDTCETNRQTEICVCTRF